MSDYDYLINLENYALENNDIISVCGCYNFSNSKKIELIRKILKRNSTLINKKQGEGHSELTPLTYCIQFVDHEIVKYLLENGADPNLTVRGMSPLMFASFKSCLTNYDEINTIKTTELLLRHGADAKYVEKNMNNNLLHIVYQISRHPGLISMLVRYGADENVVNKVGKLPIDYKNK